MKDGTLMTREKAFDFAKTNTFGACSKAHQLTQQAMHAPRVSLQPATVSQDITDSTEAVLTKKRRGRRPNMVEAFVVGVQGKEHKQVGRRKTGEPAAKRLKTEKSDPKAGLDVGNRRLIKQLNCNATGNITRNYTTDEDRECNELDEKTLSDNYNAVEVRFI
jgi:hypothetical protein